MYIPNISTLQMDLSIMPRPLLNSTNQTSIDKDRPSTSATAFVVQPITASQGIEHAEFLYENTANGGDDRSDGSNSDYVSFESEDEDDDVRSAGERQARERERQMVLEAAGLIVNQNVKPPPTASPSSTAKVAPVVPRRRTVRKSDPYLKDLPPLPDTEPMDHAARLDDALERFKSIKNKQLSDNRLSLISMDSVSLPSPTISTSSSIPPSTTRENEGQKRYSQFLQFLGGSKVQEQERKSISTLTISGPISGAPDDISRSASPKFGAVCTLFFS
jgi:hypothetical protein